MLGNVLFVFAFPHTLPQVTGFVNGVPLKTIARLYTWFVVIVVISSAAHFILRDERAPIFAVAYATLLVILKIVQVFWQGGGQPSSTTTNERNYTMNPTNGSPPSVDSTPEDPELGRIALTAAEQRQSFESGVSSFSKKYPGVVDDVRLLPHESKTILKNFLARWDHGAVITNIGLNIRAVEELTNLRNAAINLLETETRLEKVLYDLDLQKQERNLVQEELKVKQKALEEKIAKSDQVIKESKQAVKKGELDIKERELTLQQRENPKPTPPAQPKPNPFAKFFQTIKTKAELDTVKADLLKKYPEQAEFIEDQYDIYEGKIKEGERF